MGLDRQKTGQIGVNVVERIILREWEGRWQPLDSVNDDGVDGLVFLESHGVPTGQIIFVQVKCTKLTPNGNGVTAVPIERNKLLMNVERWRRVVGAAILVHVNSANLDATWVNLRATGAIGNTQVYVPSNSIFDKSARKLVAALCGTIHRDMLMKKIKVNGTDFPYFSDEHIQAAARRFYKELGAANLQLGRTGLPIRFSREGWKHLTRRDRPRAVQLQSFQLLGTIRKIVQSATLSDVMEIRSKKNAPADMVYLIAAVSFTFRQTAIVKIVFHKRADVNGTNYSFHTIYEPRRRRDVMGVL